MAGTKYGRQKLTIEMVNLISIPSTNDAQFIKYLIEISIPY